MKRILQNKAFVALVVIVLVFAIMIVGFTFYRYDTERLLKAIEEDDVAAAKQLLDKGLDPNRPNVDPGLFWEFLEYAPRRPLEVACHEGNIEMIQLLIDYGATAEEIEGMDWSPLRQTLFHFDPDDVEVVKLLLANGAEPDAPEVDELPAFVAAQMLPWASDPDTSKYIREYDEATAKGITEIVIILLGDTSIDDTTYSRMDRTLLIHAVVNENLYLADYLISQGCDLTIADCHDKTAMDYAIESGNEEMIALLREAESKVGAEE